VAGSSSGVSHLNATSVAKKGRSMMFPIGDDNTARRTVPWVTYGLIALNVLFFFAELRRGTLSFNSGPSFPVAFLRIPPGIS